MFHNKKVVFILICALVLPLLIVAVYMRRTARSEASASCAPGNITTERVSNSAARIQFDTPCAVKAKVFCAVGREGVEFLCGEDAEATMTHIINTSEVTLNSETPYFVLVDTQMEKKSLSYIQASPTDPTVGRDINLYNEETVGKDSTSADFNVELDINHDGVVNQVDRAFFYPEQ